MSSTNSEEYKPSLEKIQEETLRANNVIMHVHATLQHLLKGQADEYKVNEKTQQPFNLGLTAEKARANRILMADIWDYMELLKCGKIHQGPPIEAATTVLATPNK